MLKFNHEERGDFAGDISMSLRFKSALRLCARMEAIKIRGEVFIRE